MLIKDIYIYKNKRKKTKQSVFYPCNYKKEKEKKARV